MLEFSHLYSPVKIENYPKDSELNYRISDEIQKLRNINSDGYLSVNWKKIIKDSVELLEKEAKDIKVWGYLSIAVLIEHGLKKYIETIELLDYLITEQWESLYPPVKRLKGRKISLRWWCQESVKVLEIAEILKKDLKERETEQEESEDKKQNQGKIDRNAIKAENEKLIKQSYELLEIIDIKKIKMERKEREAFFKLLNSLEERLSSLEININFTKLTKLLEVKIEEISVANTIKKEVKKVKDAAEKAYNSLSGNTKGQISKADNNKDKAASMEKKQENISPQKDKPKKAPDYGEMTEQALLREAKKPLRIYQQKIRDKGEFSNSFLLVNEFLSRLELTVKPEVDPKNMHTHLPAPAGRERLAGLGESEKWIDLISECCDLRRDHKFWFDLDYYICQGLLGLGKKQEAKAFLYRTRSFIKLIGKEVLQYRFNDGSELASIFTREWLEENETEETTIKRETAESNQEPEKEKTLKERGEDLVKSNKLLAAIDLIREEIYFCNSKREEANMIKLAAHFYELSGKNEEALGLMQNCYLLIKKSSIADWERELLIEVIEKIFELKSSCKGKIYLSEEELQIELRKLEPLESIIRRK